MAKEDEDTTKKPSGLVKILIGTFAGLGLVGIGLAGGYFLFGQQSADPSEIAGQIIARTDGATAEPKTAEDRMDDASEGEDVEPQKVSKETPKDEIYRTLYFEFPEKITTNLKNSRRFLQLGIGVSTKYDEEILVNVENNLPALKAELLAALSDYSDEMIEGREARKTLAEDLRTVINATLEELEGFGGIEGVHLTSFVIQ